ncbi:hypothetical protein BDW68DRAFT_192145 [Aspergillus falconensis]
MTAPGHSFEKAIAVIPIDANPYLAYLNTAWRHSQRALPNSLDAFPKHTTTYGQPERGRARGRHPKPIVQQINLKRRASTILTIQEIKLDARVNMIHVTLSQASDRTSRELGLEVKVLAYVTLAPPDMEESPHVGRSTPGAISPGVTNFKALAEDDVDGEWKAGHAAPTLLHTLKNLKLHSPSLTLLLKTVEECAGKGAEHWAHFAPGGKPARWSNEGWCSLQIDFLAALDCFAAGVSGEPAGEQSAVALNVSRTWDGELVVTSTQVALVVDPARSVKARLQVSSESCDCD